MWHTCQTAREKEHHARNECNFFNTLVKSAQKDDRLMFAGQLLERAASLCPETTALICKDESITYRQLYERACAVSNLIIARGIHPRDRVFIFFENSIEFYIAYFGAWQMGAVVVPLNIFLQPVELDHVLRDAQPELILCAKEKVALFEQTGRALPPILTQDDLPKEASGACDNFESYSLDDDEMAAILYTSGTTGLPKGVMLSSYNIMMNIMQGIARLQLTSRERVLGVLPLFHSFAQLASIWGPFFLCCTVIVVPKIERHAILAGLAQKPTFFLGVPALYGLLCLFKNASLETVKYFICGGDALSDRVRGAFELIYRRKICCGYGLTETSPLISADFDDELMPTNNAGKPCISINVEVRDEQGRVLAQGAIGELWVNGPNVMLGYYRAPEATASIMKDGWLNTGDLGYIDAQGRIIITGRMKDLIIHKGFNIYPQEIENVIISHANVLAVGVIGQEDEATGEVPVAFVQLKKAQDHIDQELKKLCQQRLAPYKVPRLFICSSDQLPLTTTGKVDKKVLRKRIKDSAR